MSDAKNPFEKLPGDDTLPAAVRALQVPLQAELMKAGALWEESLAILGEMTTHRRPFPSAADALNWYRAPYHPKG